MARFHQDMQSSRLDEDEDEDEFPPAPDATGRPDTSTTRPDTALSSRRASSPQFQSMQKDVDSENEAFCRSRERVLPALHVKGAPGVCPYKLAKTRVRQTGISSVHRLPFGVVKLPPASKEKRKTKWDKTHWMLPGDNEQKPQGVRNYFAVQETEDELRFTLSHSHRPWADSLLHNLSKPELRKGDKGHPLTRSVLNGDADLGCSPNRHRHGGTMNDRDGKRHGWNNRCNFGIINDGHLLYGTQREYFGKPSSFGRAASQLWRRQNEYESKPGVWKPGDTMRRSGFGPLGSMERIFVDPYSTCH